MFAYSILRSDDDDDVLVSRGVEGGLVIVMMVVLPVMVPRSFWLSFISYAREHIRVDTHRIY